MWLKSAVGCMQACIIESVCKHTETEYALYAGGTGGCVYNHNIHQSFVSFTIKSLDIKDYHLSSSLNSLCLLANIISLRLSGFWGFGVLGF